MEFSNQYIFFLISLQFKAGGQKAILAFSLPRNWYRLISIPQTEESRVLRYIQGFRYITIFFVIWGHTLVGITLGFNLNPYKVEESFHQILPHLNLNALSMVQCFFSISGLLMAFEFAGIVQKQKKFNINYLWMGVIYRYIRLTPVYFFMMLFDSTWLYKLQNGPGWKRIAETERHYCRKNMWTNLLYVNNYINVEEGCMPVTWYLAVDMQMFIIGLSVMMLIWRFPQIKKTILGICCFTAVTLPGLLTYMYKFDGIFLLTPEDRRFLNHSEMFVKMYVPVHVNMGNYFFGIATGLYCHYARTVKMPGPKMRKFILIGAYLMPILCAFVITLHYFFYANDFEKPSIWMALMSILTKNLWSYFCVFCTCAMVLKIEKFFINFLQMKIFQPLGRITYCIFLCHFDLMRILAAEARENMTVSSFMVMASVTTVFFFANFLALILCLCLEFPSTALLKMWIKKETAIQKEDENKNIELTQDMNSNTIKNPI
uniref:CSON013311 protein n=1 Tax=Culicoides sonorensis TaxID=179676 RepID=A0A336N0M2_CULSO